MKLVKNRLSFYQDARSTKHKNNVLRFIGFCHKLLGGKKAENVAPVTVLGPWLEIQIQDQTYEAGLHIAIQNLSYISYAFIYFHLKGRFQHGVNASQMSYFHVTSMKRKQFRTVRSAVLLCGWQWTLRMGPIEGTQKLVRNYHYSQRNNPEERSSQLRCGGSLKSRKHTQLLHSQFVVSVLGSILFPAPHLEI